MEDKIRWKVTDPLGNEVVLYELTFVKHVRADHATKDAENRAAIEEQVKYTIKSPRFIIKDKIDGRIKYLDLVDVPEINIKRYRTLAIIVDTNINPNKIITWFARRAINEDAEESIYDARICSNKA